MISGYDQRESVLFEAALNGIRGRSINFDQPFDPFGIWGVRRSVQQMVLIGNGDGRMVLVKGASLFPGSDPDRLRADRSSSRARCYLGRVVEKLDPLGTALVHGLRKMRGQK